MNDKPHWRSGELASKIALGATGVAAFVPAMPLATGLFLGTAALSGSFAAYQYYKGLKEGEGAGAKKEETKVDY